MKENILHKTGEIFLKFGFKSVTMDDIANQLAISKKTIYKYFKNKEDLVEQVVTFIHNECNTTIQGVCKLGYNAIRENFEVKKMFKDMFKNSDDSKMYQLQKYYPEIYNKVLSKEFLLFQDCIHKNLEKGISEELYRADLDKTLTTKFYFALVFSVHDPNLFDYKKNPVTKLEIDVLEYHTRSIATEKGIKELEKQLLDINEN